MPVGGEGVTAQWIVRNCPEVASSQRAAAIMHAGLDTGYFEKTTKTVGNRTETYYLRLAKRRTEEEKAAARRSSVVSNARLENERLAREIYEKASYSALGVTTQWVFQQGIPGISTTQKATAVLRVGVDLKLFEKTTEKQGEETIVRYRKVPGK